MEDEKQKQWEYELDYAIKNNKEFIVAGEMVLHEMLRLQAENAKLKKLERNSADE